MNLFDKICFLLEEFWYVMPMKYWRSMAYSLSFSGQNAAYICYIATMSLC